MNREMMREANKIGKRLMKLPAGDFVEIPFSELRNLSARMSNKVDRAWKNNHYVVQLYRSERVLFGRTMDKIMIRRNDAEPIKDWHALQNIKNQICGDEVLAIQCFPKKSELVDVANMYWLFFESGVL